MYGYIKFLASSQSRTFENTRIHLYINDVNEKHYDFM